MTDWIAALLLVAGAGFCVVAGIGVVRFRDVYTRMHAATKAGTFGLALVAAGTSLAARSWATALEAAGVFLFLIATAPIGAHLIGRAAFHRRVPEAPGTVASSGAAAFRDDPATPPGDRASAESGAP
jgi:multicomponent Na+:H+ antiporter subunit G